MQPAGDHLARSNRRRFAHKDKESCLERILGVLVMRDNSAAYAPDHRAMSLYESCEREFVLVLDELIQQLAVAHAAIFGMGRSAKIPDNLGKLVNRHAHHPLAEVVPTSYCPAGGVFIGFFLAMSKSKKPRL